MPLDLPDGEACFVDSNIFYYALVPTPIVSVHCLALLDRAIAGRIFIRTSVAVLSDTIHKVMISEVAKIARRDRAGMIGFLNKHPEIIAQLVEYPQAMDRLSVVPMILLDVDVPLLRSATQIAVKEQLLTNDSMIIATMQRHGLKHLVTNDDDFDRLSGITIWKPR